MKYARKAFCVDLSAKYKAISISFDISTEARNTETAVAIQVTLQATNLSTKSAVDEDRESSGEDHEGIVEEAVGKKRA